MDRAYGKIQEIAALDDATRKLPGSFSLIHYYTIWLVSGSDRQRSATPIDFAQKRAIIGVDAGGASTRSHQPNIKPW